MVNKTRIMLYVDDLDLLCDFWQSAFDATIVRVIDLPNDFTGIILSISDEVELGLFPNDFILEYSPEVIGNTPSLMLFVHDFKKVRSRLKNPGDIIVQGGTLTCNFVDPEGNYFVLAQG